MRVLNPQQVLNYMASVRAAGRVRRNPFPHAGVAYGQNDPNSFPVDGLSYGGKYRLRRERLGSAFVVAKLERAHGAK